MRVSSRIASPGENQRDDKKVAVQEVYVAPNLDFQLLLPAACPLAELFLRTYLL